METTTTGRARTQHCRNCAHFRNSPEYLESVYRGMTTMSSGYASVRKEDGICLLHDLYLSADAQCEQHQALPRQNRP